MKKTQRAIEFIEKFIQEKDTKLIPIMQKLKIDFYDRLKLWDYLKISYLYNQLPLPTPRYKSFLW